MYVITPPIIWCAAADEEKEQQLLEGLLKDLRIDTEVHVSLHGALYRRSNVIPPTSHPTPIYTLPILFAHNISFLPHLSFLSLTCIAPHPTPISLSPVSLIFLSSLFRWCHPLLRMHRLLVVLLTFHSWDFLRLQRTTLKYYA